MFEIEIQRFFHYIEIIGLKVEVTEEDRLLVASSAIIPVFGSLNTYYVELSQVFLTDKAVRDLGSSFTLGEVRLGTKTTLFLSKRALHQGFKNLNDRSHVGIHEFAHILDLADGSIDGIPSLFMDEELIEEWEKRMHSEIERIQKGKSTIRDYGATNTKEFFAVVTEYFFENPNELKKNHPKIYKILQTAFNQDLENHYLKRIKRAFSSRKKIRRNDLCPCGSGEKFKNCCKKNSKI